MRIISGIRRGHKLCDFAGMDVRPTTDRVKEAMFSLIQDFIPDAVCLDMFSGSGALALEAISRGARRAVLTDNDKRSVEIIKKNIASLGFSDMCEVKNISCFDYIARTNEKFDIIFLDPPYNKNYIEKSLRAIAENDILTGNGIAVLESDSPDFSGEVEGLSVYKQRRYGRTIVTVYRRV